MKRLKNAAIAALLAGTTSAWAGYDIYGTVSWLEVRPSGDLWFSITPSSGYQPITNFCLGGGMYIPGTHPQYPYYFALLHTSLTKSKIVGFYAIDTYNGTTSCDITKTGYGVRLHP